MKGGNPIRPQSPKIKNDKENKIMRKQYNQPIVQTLTMIPTAHLCAGSPIVIGGSVVGSSGVGGNPGDAL